MDNANKLALLSASFAIIAYGVDKLQEQLNIHLVSVPLAAIFVLGGIFIFLITLVDDVKNFKKDENANAKGNQIGTVAILGTIFALIIFLGSQYPNSLIQQVAQTSIVLGIPSIIIGYFVKKELEKLHADFDLRNKLFDSMIKEISQTSRQAQERKLQAITICWEKVLKLEKYTSECTAFFDILLPEEYAEQITPGKMFHRAISKKNVNELLTFLDTDVETERPFLNEKIWGLYRALNTFQGRICLKLIDACKTGHQYDWKKDTSLLNMIKGELSDQEFEYITKRDIVACSLVVAILKQKLIREFELIVEGKASFDSSLEYVEKSRLLTELLKKQN